MIGLAQTGSGKTATFAIPIIQALLGKVQPFFALVLSPTRELAFQIAAQFEALGASIGLRCAALCGGVDMMAQTVALAKRPHVIVGTPGRVVDHLSNTKGFSLKALRALVLDEADKLLDMDFEAEIDQILAVIPRERRTLLFSATMTSKVHKLQRASLRNPVKVRVPPFVQHRPAEPMTRRAELMSPRFHFVALSRPANSTVCAPGSFCTRLRPHTLWQPRG